CRIGKRQALWPPLPALMLRMRDSRKRTAGRARTTLATWGDVHMPMDAKEIERLIKESIPDAEVTIRDLAGDGDHYAAHVVSSAFVGQTRVQEHQRVYEAIGGRMGDALHALALTTSPRKE